MKKNIKKWVSKSFHIVNFRQFYLNAGNNKKVKFYTYCNTNGLFFKYNVRIKYIHKLLLLRKIYAGYKWVNLYEYVY